MNSRMPVLFIGHGSPMNSILDNEFTRSLAAWGASLPRPRALMVISAHWLTRGTLAGCMEGPRTIHDFSGFPDELYTLQYPAPGAPQAAQEVTRIITKATVVCDTSWGLDHGSWSVLRHLFPAADIPVFQLSLDYQFHDQRPRPVSYHYELAAELSPLRRDGVLIIGSGNIVHNLGNIDFEDMHAKPFAWAVDFDEQVKNRLVRRDHEGLVRYESMGRSAHLAVPTMDHYLPMIYAAALRGPDDPLSFRYEGFQHGSISMRCFQVG